MSVESTLGAFDKVTASSFSQVCISLLFLFSFAY